MYSEHTALPIRVRTRRTSMRSNLATFVLGIVVVTIGYQLLIPIDNPSFATIFASMNPLIVQYGPTVFVVSVFLLILFGFKPARAIREEAKIQEIRKSVDDAVLFVEKAERRHGNLDDLKASLEALKARLVPLLSPTDGIAASLRH